jgi:hypothetical protein
MIAAATMTAANFFELNRIPQLVWARRPDKLSYRQIGIKL